VPINFTKDEINVYITRFRALDTDNKGYVTVTDLRRYFKKSGETISENHLHEILSEVDLNKNAQVDLGEFLQLMSALKSGAKSVSRFARAVEMNEELSKPISITRSGGGL
jgi:glycerol-3-phosphate dehydrogenase